jgi:hypothetical protein
MAAIVAAKCCSLSSIFRHHHQIFSNSPSSAKLQASFALLQREADCDVGAWEDLGLTSRRRRASSAPLIEDYLKFQT